MTRKLEIETEENNHEVTRITDLDLHLFNEGSHHRLYRKLGAHLIKRPGDGPGTSFAVWAPNAESLHVVGEFNGWSTSANPMIPRGSSGIWESFVPEAAAGSLYKYHLCSRFDGYKVDKADPFAFRQEVSPKTASQIWDLSFEWNDRNWMERRAPKNRMDAPISIYEVHLGSWMRIHDQGDRFLSYAEIGPRLADYVLRLGFTHVELLPVMEHPFYGSWGYQVTSNFAPTSRYGTPQELMGLIDLLHQRGIGVILDWVPAHFPRDEHGIGFFDGTHLYEHADPRQGLQPDWDTLVYNYGRQEVVSYLTSSAFYWLDLYHADGLRVDGVASMLYLDYSRSEGEWIPNEHGGRENLDAIAFLRHLNQAVSEEFPSTTIIAEESTAWPMVTRSCALGGLGFGGKWDMGWMHDTLDYLSKDPVFRKFHHNRLTFRSLYAFQENFVLPLSHDEVVHGKGSLLSKMPGDEWQQFANLRLLLASMMATPAKKLLFMGGEFGQKREWDHDQSLDWFLLNRPRHRGIQRLVMRLNQIYREEPALHKLDCRPEGHRWIDGNDADQSIVAFLRLDETETEKIVVVCNYTPVPRHDYKIGVDEPGFYAELVNSDATEYGGSGLGNLGGVESAPVPFHGRPQSLSLTLPPLAALFLKKSSN